MNLPAWREEAITKSHNRQSFDCGNPAMNEFLRRHARQSHVQNAAKTFCAIETSASHRVLGFYTVAPSAVARETVPEAMAKGLP